MRLIRDSEFNGQPGLYEGEVAFLVRMANMAPDGVGLEIGTRHGYSLLQWASARQGRGEAIGIELLSLRKLRQNIARSGLPITLVIGDSATAPLGPKELAFVFMDGDHRPEGIQADIERFIPMVIPGGIVVFHDYGRRRKDGPIIGVTDAVNAWQRTALWSLMGSEQTMIAFRRPA